MNGIALMLDTGFIGDGTLRQRLALDVAKNSP
jgi:hypothetical protein